MKYQQNSKNSIHSNKDTNGMRERINKMTDIIANIAFNVGKGLNSKELNEINFQLALFIQQEIGRAITEERLRLMSKIVKEVDMTDEQLQDILEITKQ